ncbi:uncharacterized protein LOC124295608 isoform X1 [Neodiprion lecontei]|uniref:Uncharacterized protein LOC124295608 isoform X1 n=2 Tax=Neodiprion lecontei TaxID=441921 RepID=A0ABM3GPD7_NEOLC|nr:uncharacterized protein LOC124295608 isoform X1 [Neodiprion lecontei]
MGDHARGDCKNAICSSEEEELQQGVYNNFVHVAPITYAMMAHLNINEKRFPVPGTSGEAPALPMPPTADDTDRQFWAEDELSGSESRLRLVCKQRRRRSVAYRNRVAIRKRSRSLLRQSSSSNSDPGIRMKIMSPISHGAHRRRRCNQEQGSPLTKKSRELSNRPTVKASASRPPFDVKVIGCNLASGLHCPNSRRQIKTPGTSVLRIKSRRRKSQTQSSCPHGNNVPRTTELIDNDEYKEQKFCPPSKSKRK